MLLTLIQLSRIPEYYHRGRPRSVWNGLTEADNCRVGYDGTTGSPVLRVIIIVLLFLFSLFFARRHLVRC